MKFLLGLLCVFVAYSQVNNRICPISTKDINVVKTLPRFGAKGQLGVSQNWGDYPFIVCDGSAANRTCEANKNISPTNDDFKDYFTSIIFYPAFGIFMFIVTLLSGIGLGIGRYCCCCVKGGCCGKRYPTRKTTCCGFGGIWGYVPIKNADGTAEFGYPTVWRWATRGYMALFVFFIFLWIGLGHFDGNEGLTESMVSVAAAPTPLSDTIIGAAPIIEDYLEDLMGDAFVVLLRDVNKTVNDAVNLDLAFTNVNCVLDAADNFPNISEIQDFIRDSIDQFTNTSDIFNAMNNATADLKASVGRINDSIDGLRNLTVELTHSLNDSLGNISDSLTQSDQLVFIQNAILNDTNGLEVIISDGNALDDNIPPSQNISEVTTNVPGSIPEYITTPQSSASTRLLRQRLMWLLDGYSRIPNLNTTADNMVIFNNNVQKIKDEDMVTNFSNQVNATKYALQNIISDSYTQAVNDSIQNILTQVRNVSWDGLYNVLDLVNQTIKNSSKLTDFQNRLETITNLSAIIPCVTSLLNQVTGINDTLLVFPENVQSSLDQLKDFNKTLQDVDAKVKNFSNEIQSYIDDSLNVNLTTYKLQIDDMKNQTNSEADKVDTNEIIDRLRNATQTANLTQFDQIQSDLSSLNDSLQNASIKQNVIDGYRNLEVKLEELRGMLRRGINDLSLYLNGFCSPNTSQPCDDSGACLGGGTCTLGGPVPTMRCKLDTAAPPPTTCQRVPPNNGLDSGCPGADNYCLNSRGFWTNLTIAINITDNLPDDNETQSNLNELNNTLIRNLQDGYQQQISDAQSAVSNVSTSSLLGEIDSLTDALDTFDIDNMTAQFNDLLNQTQNINLSELYEQVDDLNGTFAEIEEKKSELAKIRDLVNILDKLLFDRLPAYLDIIDNIETVGAQSGLAGEVLVLARDVVDDLIKLLNNQTFFDPITLNATEKTETPRDILSLFSDAKYTKNGPWNFFMSIVDKYNNETTLVYPPKGKGYQVFKDNNGDEYGNFTIHRANETDKNKTIHCFTMDCIENTIRYYNNQPISKLIKESNVSLPAALQIGNLDASRTDLVSAPYLVPFFTAIFAAISCVLIFPGKTPDFVASLFASITTCLSFSCMPFIFFFAGTFFILPIIGGDACLSIENVGYQYLRGKGDSTCQAFGGNETGTLNACPFEIGDNNASDPDAIGFQFVLDIERTYSQVLGGCSGTDPLAPIYAALRQSALNEIPEEVDKQVRKLNESADGLQLRQPLIDVLSKFGRNLGNTTADFVTDVSGLLGCENAHKVYSSAKNAFCCDVMTAVYWMTASWYLIAWTMLLCGCGAGILGRKRFPYALWGDEYNHDRNQHMDGEFQGFVDAKSGPIASPSGDIALDEMSPVHHDGEAGSPTVAPVEGADRDQAMAPQHHIEFEEPDHFVAAEPHDGGHQLSTDGELDREMGRVE